jgi:hypothetical protein
MSSLCGLASVPGARVHPCTGVEMLEDYIEIYLRKTGYKYVTWFGLAQDDMAISEHTLMNL